MNEHAPNGSATPVGKNTTSWKGLISAALTLAVVVAALTFWRATRSAQPGWGAPGPVDVVALTVKPEAAPVTLEAVGELRAVRQVTVANEVPGRIAEIAFESGKRSREGAVLIRLDDSTEAADLAAAKAGATFAAQQWTRTGELAAAGAASKEVLQQRRAERDQTAAQVEQIETRIRKMHIRAPFAGELGLRQVDPGQYLNAGDKIVTLTDLDTLYVNFNVPQQDLAQLQVGQRVDVRTDLPGTGPWQARVTAIEPQVAGDTRNASVQATLSNPQHALRPGMYVKVSVALPAEPNALVVPATTIMTSATGSAAAVVRNLNAQGIGKAQIVPIETGRHVGEQIVVTQGLAPGDVVVTEGQLRLQPGAAVHVLAPPAASRSDRAGAANATGS